MVTMKESATITVTRETQQKWDTMVKAIAEAFQPLVDAMLEALKGIVAFLAVLETGRPVRHAGHAAYPGVTQGFARRGRGGR